MKRYRWLALLLVVLIFTSCNTQGAGSTPGTDPVTPAAVVATPSASPAEETTSMPTDQPLMDGEIDFSIGLSAAPWQEAYVEMLSEIAAKEAPFRADGAYSLDGNVPDSYALYDIDKDGIPELLVLFGTCEADYWMSVYQYRDGEVNAVGDFGFSHGSLYTCPDEPAVLLEQGHMGGHEITKYSMEDGKLGEGESLLSEYIEGEGEYTDIEEVVPGTERVLQNRVMIDLPEIGALTLPVYQYTHPGHIPTGDKPQEARSAITDALDGKRNIYAVSGDGYTTDVGEIAFEDYVQPGVAPGYAKRPMIPQSYTWLDLNGDGQEELLLHLKEEAGESDYLEEILLVLSFQEGTVYTYSLSYVDPAILHEDGRFYRRDGNTLSIGSLYFYKNQCYLSFQEKEEQGPGLVQWNVYEAGIWP